MGRVSDQPILSIPRLANDRSIWFDCQQPTLFSGQPKEPECTACYGAPYGHTEFCRTYSACSTLIKERRHIGTRLAIWSQGGDSIPYTYARVAPYTYHPCAQQTRQTCQTSPRRSLTNIPYPISNKRYTAHWIRKLPPQQGVYRTNQRLLFVIYGHQKCTSHITCAFFYFTSIYK